MLRCISRLVNVPDLYNDNKSPGTPLLCLSMCQKFKVLVFSITSIFFFKTLKYPVWTWCIFPTSWHSAATASFVFCLSLEQRKKPLCIATTKSFPTAIQRLPNSHTKFNMFLLTYFIHTDGLLHSVFPKT